MQSMRKVMYVNSKNLGG